MDNSFTKIDNFSSFGRKSIHYQLQPITIKNHFNVSVSFEQKGKEMKTILYLQVMYKDTLQAKNNHFSMISIETIKFTLAKSIVEYYNTLLLGETLQMYFYDLPEMLTVKNHLKECNERLQLQHPFFHTFLRMANYILNCPLYSKTNMHIASIYHHQLFDFDPSYISAIYNPILYTFNSENDSPMAEYSILKKEHLKRLNVFGCVFIQFNRIIVIVKEKEKYCEGTEIYSFVNQLKYQSQFPCILTDIVLKFTGGDLLDYSFLDDNPNAFLSQGINGKYSSV